MSQRRLFFSLLASLVVCVVSGPGLVAQTRQAAVVAIREEAVELILSRPSYVVVAEVRPRQRPRILFPHIDDDWKPLAAGAVRLGLSGSLPAIPPAPGREAPHCLVGPTSLAQWSPAEGDGSIASRSACGALPTMTQYAGGTGPWEAWSTPRYDVEPHTEYLVIVVLDGTTNAVSPNAAATFLGPGLSPVAVARVLGGLSTRYKDSSAWQGTVVRLR